MTIVVLLTMIAIGNCIPRLEEEDSGMERTPWGRNPFRTCCDHRVTANNCKKACDNKKTCRKNVAECGKWIHPKLNCPTQEEEALKECRCSCEFRVYYENQIDYFIKYEDKPVVQRVSLECDKFCENVTKCKNVAKCGLEKCKISKKVYCHVTDGLSPESHRN